MSIKPKLNYFDLTMIVVSMVIGIGIFKNPGIVAQKAGTVNIFFASWIVGGIICIFGALTFAEIGSRIPVVGGFYKMFLTCYHRVPAFMLIWSYLLLNAGSASAVALAGAQFITPVLLSTDPQHTDPRYITLVFFAIVFGIFGLNYMGIKIGSRAQNILSSLKIILMLVLIGCIFTSKHATAGIGAIAPTGSSNWLQAIGLCLVAVFFSYGGYQNTTNLGGDVISPRKTIPRSIITAMLLVMALYITINVAYVKVLGFENLQRSNGVAADFIGVIFGDIGSRVASVIIFISILGFLNASFLYNPRVMYAMAEEGVLPKIFMKVNEKKQVQPFALVAFTVLLLGIFLLLENYNNLLNFVIFNDTISLALAAGCIFILRKKQANDTEEKFTVWGYPFIPAIFIIVTLGVNISIVLDDINSYSLSDASLHTNNSLIGSIFILAGVPLYYLMKKISTKS